MPKDSVGTNNSAPENRNRTSAVRGDLKAWKKCVMNSTLANTPPECGTIDAPIILGRPLSFFPHILAV